MRITILTVGSRGDVQPFMALGAGLRAAGHEVTLATHQEWAERVRGAGLGFARVEGAPHRFMLEEQGQRWMAGGSGPLEFLRLVYPHMLRLLREQLADAAEACASAEALVFTPLAVAGYHLAEKLRIPCCGASLQPVSPTRSFPSPLLPPLLPFGPVNLVSHVLVDRGYAEVWRGEVNRWRRQRLGLLPLLPGHSYSRLAGRQLPILYGFSTAVVPRPFDWSPRLHVTGYWFLESKGRWQPPDALLDFLADGEPPVYVGLGSMVVCNAPAVAAVARRAAALAGRRLILAGNLGEAAGVDPSGNVAVIEEAPHDWLFPRVAAVVHHGGAGTTAAGLRAGLPSVIVPLVSDQFFWGDRIRALGAGPDPIPLRRLTAEKLASAIMQAVQDTRMRERAAEIGRSIRQEDGVARAVEAVRDIFRCGMPASPTRRRIPRETR